MRAWLTTLSSSRMRAGTFFTFQPITVKSSLMSSIPDGDLEVVGQHFQLFFVHVFFHVYLLLIDQLALGGCYAA